MRKPRDIDAELAALTSKARDLRARKVTQLGELVIASGADALAVEQLAGALLAAAAATDAKQQEVWRAAGAAFFQRTRRGARAAAAAGDEGGPASNSAPSPPAGTGELL